MLRQRISVESGRTGMPWSGRVFRTWMGVAGTTSINWETQEYALCRYNANEGSWTIKLEWVDSNLVPLGFTTDGDHGEYYATAKGGDHRTI